MTFKCHCRPLTLVLGAAFLLSCSSSETQPPNVYRSGDRPLVDSKYSLSEDRKILEDMRAQIPEEKRRENDELALVLNLFSPERTNRGQKPPSEIRSKFDEILRKKRELFDRDLKKEREGFTAEERKKREEFLKLQQRQRDEFMREKHTRDEKSDFYKEQDAKRSEHFATERDRRQDFESDVRERRKSFEDYVREKRGEFDQELRNYQKRQEEAKKASLKTPGFTPSSEVLELERELEEAKKRAATPLESGE